MRPLMTLRPPQSWGIYRNGSCSSVIHALGYITASSRRSHSRCISTIRSADNSINEATFYDQAYVAQEPLVIRDYLKPSVFTWFHENQHGTVALDSKLAQYSSTPDMPYEYVRTSSEDDAALANFISWLQADGGRTSNFASEYFKDASTAPKSEDQTRFDQFTAPVSLLSKAIEFNAQQGNSKMRLRRLYIAQMPINELAPDLQRDLEAPKLLRCSTAPCDVYNTSIWLGLEPTYTPWHRDPNPNFFMQLVSQKTLRLLPPGPGGKVFMQVQNAIGSASNSRIRGAEMMQGPERSALHSAIWSDDAPKEILETTLEPYDCLFIPKGWWHSVKSVREDGHMNASVNWWFRFRQTNTNTGSARN